MRTTLITPPLVQLNTPYPATAYLGRALREAGLPCTQRDLGIELVHRVFSASGLRAIFDAAEAADGPLPPEAWKVLAQRRRYEATIDAMIAYLRGDDRGFAPRLRLGGGLPIGPRAQRAKARGLPPGDDAARLMATHTLADLVDLIAHCIDPGFSLSRYQHHLAVGPVSFDPIAARLEQTTLIDAMLDDLADAVIADSPDLLGVTVPFPGTLYAALRIGRRARAAGIPVLMGGGYVNTELREVSEPRLWDCVDALTHDDGEGPLLAWIEHAAGGADSRHRTRTRKGSLDRPAPSRHFVPAAWYGDLDLSRYLQVLDTTNPAHRLWSDGRWNKITLAHGCYWRRCAFCDVSLDYISRFEPARITTLVDQMSELIEVTGHRGFHFTDEAAPPRLLRDLALEILRRDLAVTLWGNIRFERAFTPDLCRLLAAAGLVAVTGGLEVASDRLLRAMDKGITVKQAARASQAFQQAGVRVHAYLMYGFPTQTDAETVDSMEVVRQMFAAGVIDSAFWHRFVLTRHSPVARDPERFGVVVPPAPSGFALNDLPHRDPTGGEHDRFDRPLEVSLAAWMAGTGLDRSVASWFDAPVPSPTAPPDLIARSLGARPAPLADKRRLIWLGGAVLDAGDGLEIHHEGGPTLLRGRPIELDWITEVLEAASPAEALLFADARDAFPGDWRRFRSRWRRLRAAGLVGV